MQKAPVWRDFIAVTISIAVVGIGLGCTLPLTALVLTERGYGPNLVGWMISATAIGGIAGTLITPTLVEKMGRKKIMFGCFLIAGATVIPLQYCNSPGTWMLLRGLFGSAMAALFIIGESWINVLASDAIRGRVVAIYTTSFTLFQVLGPLLTDWFSRFPNNSFVMCGALFLLGIPGIACAADNTGPAGSEPHHPQNGRETDMPWIAIARKGCVIIAGTAFFASFDSIVLGFLPLAALDAGFTQSTALVASAIVLAGDAALQYAAGWLSDHYGRERVHRCCGVAVCLLLPLLPLVIHLPVVWEVYLFFLGGCAGAIYTLSMVASGQHFSGTALLRISGLIGITWNISSSVGPALTGMLMQRFGSAAMVAVLWVMALIFMLLCNGPASRPAANTNRQL